MTRLRARVPAVVLVACLALTAAGRRTVTMPATATYGLRAPGAAAAQDEPVEAAVCRMCGRTG
ncbi:hypothetical protein [Saccharothrix australiensis]|uniref:Uncharacterized protein n=1 Tax=Saccharothrix australiensis TaxID=2072 RepID=A0A495VSF6_9PSEU|nr:hypothetical protein [Saccharothrix australiensis]RKT51627.1 hypothetical protein C8E97_0106 [Saccharothrix australiensis]